jgi:hypothetical protein
MPIEPLYSDSALLRGVKHTGCPKTSKDVSFTSLRGYPVVTDLSRQQCFPENFSTNQFLYDTNGCCVLDNSSQNCSEIAGVDASEENNYYMGVRFYDVNDISDGERKICYTTPIRKKKLHIMDLLTKLLIDIISFIATVLVAACYEYWIVYGKCSSRDIPTTLYESPYKVGNTSETSRPPPKQKTADCPGGRENTSSGSSLEWYDTFPYNLITSLSSNKSTNGSDTSRTFAFFETVKIPARSLLLGFFYCIIYSRMCMVYFINTICGLGSRWNIYPKEPTKYSQFWSGLIFIIIFMGIYGTLTHKFIIQLSSPTLLNASCLFLLSIIIIITIWFPCLYSFVIMMLTFVGYRRGSYEKRKAARTEKDSEKEPGDWWEPYMEPWDFYWLIESRLFKKKRDCVGTDDDNDVDKLYKIDDEKNLNIINEDDLDWFLPIRRSKIEMRWYDPVLENYIRDIHCQEFNFLFYERQCIRDDLGTQSDFWFHDRLYWYMCHFSNPMNLFNIFRELKVDCKDIADVKTDSYTMHGLLKFLFGLFFFWLPLGRVCINLIYLIILAFIVFYRILVGILWTCIIIIIAIYSIFIALLGNILALFYLHSYVIVGFFYVPFTHYPELFKIIKSHGTILTLLFCMIVVLAGVKVLHPTSVGVIGGILGLVVLYKLITLLSV